MAISLKYAKKKPLGQRVVFVDGLARCGKFLTCRVLSHLQGGDHWQYPVAIEYMCYMIFLGGINEAVASPFVQYISEENSYNRMIGRFLNTREDDASSIFNCPDHAEYLQRASRPSGMDAVNSFIQENRFITFQAHNAMAAGGFIFNALPEARMVHICRHPVDQIYKWFERGWGEREIEDPLSFVPTTESPAGTVPWFANNWAEKYAAATPMVRALEGVLFLQNADENGFQALSEHQSRQVHRISLEHLVTNPDDVVRGISSFLQSEPHELMESMLLEERIPRVLDLEDRQQMFQKIASFATDDQAHDLLNASRAFETCWDIEPFQP
jgi:hypothetical protein